MMDVIIPNNDLSKQIKLSYYERLLPIITCLIKLCSPDIVYTGSQYTQHQIEENIDGQIDILERNKFTLDEKYKQILNGFELRQQTQSATALDESANDAVTIKQETTDAPVPCLEEIESSNNENKEKDDVDSLYCPVCNLTFKSKENFIKDIEFHFAQRCIECNDFYISTKGYHRCFKTHKIISDRYEKAIKCKNCSFATLNKERLDEHIKQCNKTDIFLIETASNRTLNASNNHKERYYCHECDRYFKNGQALGGHRSRMHSTKRNNFCQIASSNHNKNRTQATYDCFDCGRQFESGPALGGHRGKMHPKKRRIVPEIVSSKNIKNKGQTTLIQSGGNQVNGHSNSQNAQSTNQRLASKDEIHQCHICAEVFQSQSDLIVHCTNAHKDALSKLYKCSDCDYETPNVSSLRVHIRSHTNERPYKCSIDDCNKDFTTSGNLRAHIKNIHDNKRNYQCLHCKLAFNSSYDLRVHQYIHTGEKPYKCRHCTESFQSSSHRNKHEKNKHIGWKCPFCKEKFDAECQLNNHRRAMHPNMKINGGTKWFDFGCEKCDRRFKTAKVADAHYAQCTIDIKATNDLDEMRKDVTAKCDKVNIVEIDVMEIKKTFNGKKGKKRKRNKDEPYIPRTKSIGDMNGKRRKSKRLSKNKHNVKNGSVNGQKRRWNVEQKDKIIEQQPPAKRRKIMKLKLTIKRD